MVLPLNGAPSLYSSLISWNSDEYNDSAPLAAKRSCGGYLFAQALAKAGESIGKSMALRPWRTCQVP